MGMLDDLNKEEPKEERGEKVTSKQEPIRQLDRVNFSFGMKVNTGNYESVDIHMSLSRDVEIGQTPEEVITNLQDIIVPEVERRATTLRGEEKAVATPKAQTAAKEEPKKNYTEKEKAPLFRPEYDIEYVVDVISYEGEKKTEKYGDTPLYKLNVNGENMNFFTSSKTLIADFVVGETLILRKFKDGSFTKYETKGV